MLCIIKCRTQCAESKRWARGIGDVLQGTRRCTEVPLPGGRHLPSKFPQDWEDSVAGGHQLQMHACTRGAAPGLLRLVHAAVRPPQGPGLPTDSAPLPPAPPLPHQSLQLPVNVLLSPTLHFPLPPSLLATPRLSHSPAASLTPQLPPHYGSPSLWTQAYSAGIPPPPPSPVPRVATEVWGSSSLEAPRLSLGPHCFH